MKVEYNWQKSETSAHAYILPGVLNILDSLGIDKRAYILDTGCGGGYVTYSLWSSGYTNVYGFDASFSGIEVAKNTYPEIADRFFLHDVYDHKLPENVPENYDVVLSIEVIEHLFLPRLYLKNVANWLKKDGLLILTTPYHGYIKNLIIAILNKYDVHHNPLWDFGHIKFFSKKTLFTLLEECGFKPIHFRGLGRFPFLWKSMLVVARKHE